VSAGEMGMAECSLYKHSQTVHLTVGLMSEAACGTKWGSVVMVQDCGAMSRTKVRACEKAERRTWNDMYSIVAI
jgi:hypothetical protein